jgi:tetratricopeptide (TPR) repeat protein
MLRGLIRLGNYQNFLPSIVNLDLAIQDFLLATKYAEHVARKDCSKAFELAGWASYCSGKMQDAERNFYRALEFDGDNGESKFLLSKILFHAGDTERAADQFAEALRCDHKYGLRAGSDDDFLKHRANVEACINEYRIEVQNELYRLFEPVEQNLIIKHEILSSHGLIDGRHQIKFFSNTKGKISSAPLADLIAMKSPLAEKLKDLTDEIATGKKELKKRADYLRHEKGKPFPWEIIPVLAGVLWIIGIVWFSHDVYLKNDHPIPVILLTIFFGPLAGALISAVGTAVLGTIMFAVHFLIYGVVMRMNNIEAATKIERDLPRL